MDEMSVDGSVRTDGVGEVCKSRLTEIPEPDYDDDDDDADDDDARAADPSVSGFYENDDPASLQDEVTPCEPAAAFDADGEQQVDVEADRIEEIEDLDFDGVRAKLEAFSINQQRLRSFPEQG